MADLKSQITVVEQVYHRLVGNQPCLVESRFSRELVSNEQPYERHLSVGEQGKPLDCGWVKEASQLLILNEAGRNLQVNSTKEGREETSRKVLEVYYLGAVGFSWLVYPRESIRVCPNTLEGLAVRSKSGTIPFILHVIPK